MTANDILNWRLANQQLIETKFKSAVDIVRWFGAMQAQEYPMAKWAIGLRLPGIINADIENIFNKGKILRTHVLRPTWHFVLPEDIRWMLELTAPRVHAFSKSFNTKIGLDKKIFARSNDTIARSLEGGNFLQRGAIKELLEKAKIKTDNYRLVQLLMYAELERVICSGPRIGKQFTYALFDERAPKAKMLSKSEALAELANRYFTSRAPATIYDFAWWSGLTVKEAKEGIESLGKEFLREQFDGNEYIVPADTPKPVLTLPQATFLLPDYDEYSIAYKNRSALSGADMTGASMYSHWLIVDGKIVSTWSEKSKGNKTEIQINPRKKLNKRQEQALQKSIKKYTAFFTA